MLSALPELVGLLPPAVAWPLGGLLVYRWAVIPAIRGTLEILRDVQDFRDRA
jgi:hypothetical protein